MVSVIETVRAEVLVIFLMQMALNRCCWRWRWRWRDAIVAVVCDSDFGGSGGFDVLNYFEK